MFSTVTLTRTATVILVTVSLTAPALAQSAFWHGVRSTSWQDGNVGGSSNWYTKAPPTGDPVDPPTDTATFAMGAVRKQVTFAADTTIKTMRFLAGVEDYDFTLNGRIVQIDGHGIINNAASKPLFNVGPGSRLQFFNNAAIRGGGAGPVIESRHRTEFYDQSLGGDAVVRNRAGGRTFFRGDSSAGGMVISNISRNSLVRFLGRSTGDRATIFNTRGTVEFLSRRPGDAFTIGRVFNAGSMHVATVIRVLRKLKLEARGELTLGINEPPRAPSMIIVDKDARLAGSLHVFGLPDSEFKKRYVLIKAGTRIGKFKTVTFHALPGENPRIVYIGNTVILRLDPR